MLNNSLSVLWKKVKAVLKTMPFSLAVLLFLLIGMASGVARMAHPHFESFQKSSYITYDKHNTPKSQTEIFANNDPVNFCDPDGRLATGFNAGSTELGRIQASNTVLDRRSPLPANVTEGYRDNLAFKVGLNAGRMHAGGGDIALAALPAGRVAKAVGSAIKTVAAAIKAANAGKQSTESLSNATGEAFDGAAYSPQRLQQLASYLERRGIQVMETRGNPAFIARPDNTGTMLLPRNPTALQVKHELSHYIDFRNLGFEAYRGLGRAAREMSVLHRLQGNRIWGTMNEAEKGFSINYATGIK